MKRVLLFSAGLLMAASSFAQTTLWDGESYELGSKGGCWDDGSPTVVANPDQTGINTSSKCLKFTMTSTDKVVKIPFRDWIKPNLNGARRISLMIKKSTNENVKIEVSDPTNDGATKYWEKVATWYGGNGAWQKLVFDFSTNTALNDYPGVISITAQTGDVSANEDVYIDNVEVEAVPTVNGTALSSVTDASLSGDLTLGGSWMKGSCSNADNDTWTTVNYDDYSTLNAKLTAATTSIDTRSATLSDPYNAFGNTNPNIIIYANSAFDANNVVAGGKIASLNMSEGYKFYAKEGFTADKVVLTRALVAGYNSVCLPFATTAGDLGATAIARYTSTSESDGTTSVVFTKAESVDANVPFVTVGATASASQTFTNKSIVATPTSLADGNFVGIYEPTDAEGKWGLGDQKFQKGASGATLNSFHAYLNNSSAAKINFTISGLTTGINNIKAADTKANEVYNLSGMLMTGKRLNKGIYIINHKKVIVK